MAVNQEINPGQTTEGDRFSLPLIPHVVLKDVSDEGGGENLLTLGKAVEKVCEFLTHKENLLWQRHVEVLDHNPHSKKPRGQRDKRDIRASYEKDMGMEKKLLAIDYAMVACILQSPTDKPFVVPADISPQSKPQDLPNGGEADPFYSFICYRIPPEALELLTNKEGLSILYEVYTIRQGVRQEFDSKKMTYDQSLGKLRELNRGIEIPEGLIPVVRQITNKFALSK